MIIYIESTWTMGKRDTLSQTKQKQKDKRNREPNENENSQTALNRSRSQIKTNKLSKTNVSKNRLKNKRDI